MNKLSLKLGNLILVRSNFHHSFCRTLKDISMSWYFIILTEVLFPTWLSLLVFCHLSSSPAPLSCSSYCSSTSQLAFPSFASYHLISPQIHQDQQSDCCLIKFCLHQRFPAAKSRFVKNFCQLAYGCWVHVLS